MKAKSERYHSLAEIMEILRKLKDEIKMEFKAEIIGIFGSYARGEQKAESDLDLIVKFHEDATLFDLVGLGDFLEHKLGIRVDIVSEEAIREELKNTILKETINV